MLRVRLLGPLSAHDAEGRDLTPPGGRERNGLATLAIVAPEALSTERLAAELYRERGASDPRNAVQAMVSRLRRALGRSAGAVETTANGYRLVDVTVDIDEAERLLREAMSADDLVTATAHLDEAGALWQGPTLDGLEGELVEAERLRIDGLRHDAEDSVLQRRLHGDPDPELIHDLEAAVRDEPLRELRWELLMRALYRAGRQAEALRAFQRARALLADRLGLEPGPTLTDLERRILDQDPTLRSSAEPISPPAGDPTEAPDGESAGPGRSDLPSGTLSVLLCDVVGSVRRWEVDPTDTATEIERLHRVWGEAIEAEAGTVVKSTGDGVLAVFETADRAVRAAARAMVDQVRLELRVKAAIHTGSLEPVDGDYRGPVVNRCARILDLVNGGQIVVSGPTAELARGPLAATATATETATATGTADAIGLRDLGSHWLRDVPDPMALWQVTGPGLPSSFAPLPSRDQTSLPRLRGRLLGRDQLIDRVSSLVGDEPLVTLLGPGGIGKTSTALAVGWRVLGGRPVTFVDLARIEDPSVVAERLVEAVIDSHDDDPRSPTERLIGRLATSTELVIIDNAEHLLDAVAAVIDPLLATQLKGSFLVTSRQPLGLPDEVVVGVPPLEVPTDGDDLQTTGRSPAVELFIDRARSGRPDFDVADGLLPVVAHICRRLDGIPLAIELAAGRAALLSVDDIAARLDDQLRLLRQVRSQRERRHRSLEAVMRWSVDQLTPEGREVFARASVMAGSFDLDGLEAVLAHAGMADIDALDAVDQLNGASLVAVEPGGSRFRMLEPIRQFAAAELAGRGADTETRRAHALWLTDLATEAHTARDRTRAPARARLGVEADQILAALTWVADSGQADLAGPLAYPIGFWFLTADARLGEQTLTRLVDIVDREADPLGWAQVILGLGTATAAHPRSEVERESVAAIEVFDQLDHPERGLARLAAVFAQTGTSDLELPLRLLTEAERLAPAGDHLARALIDLAFVALSSVALVTDPDFVDPAEQLGRGERALAVFRELDETWALALGLAEQGRLYHRIGELVPAERCYLESLERFEGEDHHTSHYVLSELGRMASDGGDHERATRYHAEAIRIAEIDGSQGCLALALAGQAYTAEAQGHDRAAIDLYRQALGLVQETILEAGWAEWQDALERLESKR